MKKIITIITVALLFISCGNSKDEQMIIDYEAKGLKEVLNIDINDTDFKVNSVVKDFDIKANDSIKIYKKQFASIWSNNPSEKLIDTLSYDYVKKAVKNYISQQDTLQKLYQESVLTAIRLDDYSYQLESKRKRDKAGDEKLKYQLSLSKIIKLENKSISLSENPEKVLSTKYKANTTMTNPLLKVKQTFDKVYYTNASGTEILGTIED